MEFYEDFVNVPVDDATGNPTAWETYEDAGGVFAMPNGHVGGVATLTTAATNNNEYTLQLGAAATAVHEPFVITDSSNNKLWFECRINASHTADAMVFCGFAQGGACASGDFLADDTGALADVDAIGFRYLQASPTEWDCAWRKNGQAAQEIGNIDTNAGAWTRFGFYFDGASTITVYVDGVANGTPIDTSAATFPSGEELSPIISVKTSAAGGVADSIEIDYFKAAIIWNAGRP